MGPLLRQPWASNPSWFTGPKQATHVTTSRRLQRLVVDKWDRDKAFAETLDVLNKIYGKYA